MRNPFRIKDVPIKKGAGRRWAWLTRYMIQIDGQDYLRRLRIIQTPWFGVYLHDMHGPDRDWLHDHPWPFMSVVLRGGYGEWWTVTGRHGHDYPGAAMARVIALRHFNGLSERRWWAAGSVHVIRLDEAHMIDLIRPGTRTLVFVGRRSREWGFYQQHNPNGFVPFASNGRSDGS